MELHPHQVYTTPNWGAVNELKGCLSEGPRKAGGIGISWRLTGQIEIPAAEMD